MRPLVGVTTYHREVDGRPRYTIPAAYVDAARDTGAAPLLLAPGDVEPEDLLDRIDGLMLTGGGDLDPAHGAPAHPATYFTCSERDAFEIALARAALARNLPMLAICRGMQILNVACGGTLHGHLPEQYGEATLHRVSQDEACTHGVELATGSQLRRVLGQDRLTGVPSWHHQAVASVGDGLEAVAWASDGVIEALAAPSADRTLAVQWHPELEPPGSPGRALFAQWVAWAGD